MTSIGDRIAINRQNKKMTQEEFASRLGVTPQAVSKWERGQGLPDVSLLEGICTVLSIDANTLLGLNAPKNVVENNDLSMQLEIQKNMVAEPLMIEIGIGLIQAFVEGLKTNFVNEQRKKLVAEKGLIMPVLRIKDSLDLKENEYQIKVYDKVLIRETVNPTEEGVYQYLISNVVKECEEHYSDILNKQVIKSMMDNLMSMYPGEIDDIIPEKINYLMLLDIMKEIVRKAGNLRNQIKIVEAIEREYLLNGNTDVIKIVDKILETLKV